MTFKQEFRANLKKAFSTKDLGWEMGWTMSTEEQLIMCTMGKLPGDVERLRRKYIYVIWKIFAALVVITGLVLSLIKYGTSPSFPFGQYFIFATRWTQVFVVCYAVPSCCVSVKSLR